MQQAEATVAVAEPAVPLRSPEVKRAIRIARKYAVAGRWRKVLSTLPEIEGDGGHFDLLLERLRAAFELNDEEQIAVCVEAARRLPLIAQRVHFAGLLSSGNRPVEAGTLLASLPPGSTSTKIVAVARRILATTNDAPTREIVKQFVTRGVKVPSSSETILHRYPGDFDVFDVPPSALDIVRLPGVDLQIESRVRELWAAFDVKLAHKPYPFVEQYEDVFVNEAGQIWAMDGTAIRSGGSELPKGIDHNSVPVLDEAFSCVRGNKGYYEWIIDRLSTVSWRLDKDAPDCPILFRKEQHGLAVSTLTSIGISEDKIVGLAGTVFCRKLYFGIAPTASLVRKGAFENSYGRLTEQATAKYTGDTPKRFYISRRDSTRRAMTNEAEFEAKIEKLGYAPIVLSQLGLLEKINLFRNADAVIGAHGAGFVHLIFAKPGLRVIEMIPVTMNQYSQMGYRVCFTLLSKIFGLKHTAVLHPMNPATFEWSSDPAMIADLV